jgi:predicted metal-dependent enzyme (double-stranded beta helix superfamily)
VLTELIEALRERSPLDRGSSEVGALLSASLGEWPATKRLLSRPGTYTRTCAYRDDSFELVLLNWDAGAASAIHDHGDQHCWMMVLEGRLKVDDFVRLDAGEVPGYAHVEPLGSQILEPGEIDLRSGRFDLHRVTATDDAPAISLHLYSRPLLTFLRYDAPARRCETARGIYDAVLPAYAELASA